MGDVWKPYWDDSFDPVEISQLPAIYRAGNRVWARYVGPGSKGKHWTEAEIAAWKACGPDTGVAFLAEGVGDEAITDPGIGDDHGREAVAEMRALGVPAGVLCSPAVDRNISLSQTKGPVETYFRNWTKGFGGKGVAYVEVENGGRMVADGVTAATFTPAAYSWNEKPVLITPDNAPSHVVMTQEHNGKKEYGGTIDTGHVRTDAPHVWWLHDNEENEVITDDDAVKIAAAVLNMKLGHSGPTVQIALQSGYNNTVAIRAAVDAPSVVTVDIDALSDQLAAKLNGTTLDEVKAAMTEIVESAHLVVNPPAAT